jgi:23S rRNA pseudouridine1911/1915/1917 synthase
MTTRLTATEETAGVRLDVFLGEHVEGMTRSQAKKYIVAKEVLVNGKTASVHRPIRSGDVIEIQQNATGPSKRIAATGGQVQANPRRPLLRPRRASEGAVRAPLRILAETDAWLVVYKPAGMLMHPTSKGETDTFIDAVIAHAPSVARVGEDPSEPGIVSRLDRDVSGIVVIAKTQAAYDDLKEQFKKRDVEKKYLALVYGDVPQDEGDLKFRIARSSSKARMAALPKESSEGRAAWTHYTVVKRMNGVTLLALNILTGRSHQIRAHLFAFNHPIIGDPLYTPRATKRRVNATRVMLESVALAFADPESGEEKHFAIEPDPAFEEIMRELG